MSSMSIFADALKLSTSRTRANRIHTSSSPASFVTLSTLSASTLRAPLSSPLSLREEYPSNILNGPRLKPIPLPTLSDEETEETSWASPVHQKEWGYQSTPPPSPLSTSSPSLRSESPSSWHSDMDFITESPSRPFYTYHYELPLSYTPPTPPSSNAHLHAPVTRYKQLPH